MTKSHQKLLPQVNEVKSGMKIIKLPRLSFFSLKSLILSEPNNYLRVISTWYSTKSIIELLSKIRWRWWKTTQGLNQGVLSCLFDLTHLILMRLNLKKLKKENKSLSKTVFLMKYWKILYCNPSVIWMKKSDRN